MTEKVNSNFYVKMDIIQPPQNYSNELINVTVNGHSKEDILTSNAKSLTPFELVGATRIIKNPKALEIDQEKIQTIIDQIFTCNICLNIFNEPVNSKGCLHKFCKNCIQSYILKFEPTNKGKKECPNCRYKIENRRFLREDATIKEIMKSVIPNLDGYRRKMDEFYSNNVKTLTFKQIQAKKEKDKDNIPKEIKSTIIFNNNLPNNLNSSKNNSNISTSNLNTHIKKDDVYEEVSNDSNLTISINGEEDSYCCFNNKNIVNKELNSKINNRRKTQRQEYDSEDSEYQIPHHVKGANKKMKLDKKIQEYYITKEEMESELTKFNDIVQIKLCPENNIDEMYNLFNNFKLCTSSEIKLEELSIYILNKLNINFRFMDTVNFYVKNNTETQRYLTKDMTIRQIRESYGIEDQNINLFFNFKK